MTPYFSIIMVSLNANKYITPTINSILSQNFSEYEIIIKDGGSIDSTLENIPDDPRFRLIQKQDSGIYDAMNQAIYEAKGKFLYFLNCGDELYNKNVLSRIYEFTRELTDNKVIVYGNYVRDDLTYSIPDNISEFYLYRTSLNHQTLFIGKETFDEIGIYDSSLKVGADYEFECRAHFSNKIKIYHVNVIITKYLSGGYSDTDKGKQILKTDFKKVHDKYFTKATIVKYEFLQIISLKKIRRLIDSESSPFWMRRIYRGFMNIVTGKTGR